MCRQNILSYLKKEFNKENKPSVRYAIYDIGWEFLDLNTENFVKYIKEQLNYCNKNIRKFNDGNRRYYYEKQIYVCSNLLKMIER